MTVPSGSPSASSRFRVATYPSLFPVRSSTSASRAGRASRRMSRSAERSAHLSFASPRRLRLSCARTGPVARPRIGQAARPSSRSEARSRASIAATRLVSWLSAVVITTSATRRQGDRTVSTPPNPSIERRSVGAALILTASRGRPGPASCVCARSRLRSAAEASGIRFISDETMAQVRPCRLTLYVHRRAGEPFPHSASTSTYRALRQLTADAASGENIVPTSAQNVATVCRSSASLRRHAIDSAR